MAARDDSVIRGSLIACLIFLVLSLALNFFLWQFGSTASADRTTMQDRLTSAQSDLKTLQSQATLMRAMLGAETLSEAQFTQLTESTGSDPEMEAIEQRFVADMSYFGPEIEAANRNYPALPEFLVNTLRSRNVQYGQARDEATQIRLQADSDVEVARKAMEVAEDGRDSANQKLEQEQAKFAEDRESMKLQTERTRDNLNKTVQDFSKFQKKSKAEIDGMRRTEQELRGTINSQLMELNRLRSDNFETVQGYIRYVVPDGNVVTINLGSGDQLRPGVTFGVIDGEETRLQDAKVKATIQVTRLLGSHRAEARVVARPEIRYPIIPGDKIYSPFWSSGRKVKIAIGGMIDIDGDERPDLDQIASMIVAAGAEVSAVIQPDGTEEGTLDSSTRFLVVGEAPDDRVEANAASIAALGRLKERAKELGVTVIPAWKLQSYLRTINDTLTTPLGSAVRGDDFMPEPSTAPRSLPNSLPELYLRQTEGMQQGNRILEP
ncbi:MAG: hypothetical protein AAGJ40_01070 [Planctomycetota bacterium]